MGYDTEAYTMAAIKFETLWEAALFLVKGRNKDFLKKIKVPDVRIDTWESSQADEDLAFCIHEGTFEARFGLDPMDAVEKAGLKFEFEGDARFDVNHGYLGLSIDEMGDDETKKQFINRVRDLIKNISGQDVEVAIVDFTYTC